LNFTVPLREKPAVDRLLSDIGPLLSRNNVQASLKTLTSDQKYGYQVALKSTVAIPPRETVTIRLEVKDVDRRMTEVKNLVAAGKGRVLDSTVNREESGKVLGLLKIEVPFASQDVTLQQIKDGDTV